MVSMFDRKVLRREADGRLVIHADLGSHATGHANDMVVDAEGRAYVGNFGFDLMSGARLATTSLHRVDPEMSWAEFGPLPADRVLGKALAGASVAPDGGCLDAEGAWWIADALGSRLLRVREGGEITDELRPGTAVYACAAPDFDATARTAALEGR